MAQNPGRVWKELKPYLSSAKSAYRFVVRFPQGLIECMPPDEVGVWTAEKPEERAGIMARLTNIDMSRDETPPSQLLGRYGDDERIASEFFSAYISGSWVGSASSHWDQLADALETVAGRTTLHKLRYWASENARSLRRMAQRDRQREEEEDLRRS